MTGFLAARWPRTELAGGEEGALKRMFCDPGMAKAKSLTCSHREVSRAWEVVHGGANGVSTVEARCRESAQRCFGLVF